MKNKILPIAALALSFLLGMVASVNADHGRYPTPARAKIGAKAQYLYDVSGDAQQSLFRQFNRSRNYGEMLGTIGQIRGKAIHVRTLARIDICDSIIAREVGYLDKLIHDFESQVAVARIRSERGLDPHLRGCTLHMDAKIRGMLDAVHCMSDALVARVTARPRYDTRNYRVAPGASYYQQPANNYYRYSNQPNKSYRSPRAEFSCPRGSNSGFQVELGFGGHDRGLNFQFHR